MKPIKTLCLSFSLLAAMTTGIANASCPKACNGLSHAQCNSNYTVCAHGGAYGCYWQYASALGGTNNVGTCLLGKAKPLTEPHRCGCP